MFQHQEKCKTLDKAITFSSLQNDDNYNCMPIYNDGKNLNHDGECYEDEDGDDGILVEVGLVDLVYPNGKKKKIDYCYEDKLREFVHYQSLQSFRAPEIPEAIKVCSPEGRKMLKEALNTPYMEAYYRVGPQVDNQPPEFNCGIFSLVVVLNSLDIDPARATWNDEFRWNHLGSLACCTSPLQYRNTTLDQVSRLAVCNDLRVFPKLVTDDWTLEDFRAWIKMALSRSDLVTVVNHGRREMKQLGSGHFLPLTGYHEGRDMILSYDIAKQKYVPQWMPLQMLLTATKARDDRTGENRGFMLMMPPDYDPSERIFGPSLMFRIDNVRGKMDARLKLFISQWNRTLDQNIQREASGQEVFQSAIRSYLTIARSCSDLTRLPFVPLTMTLIYFRNSHGDRSPSIVARCRRPQCPEACPNTKFRQQIENLNIFQDIRECMLSLTNEEQKHILNLVEEQLPDIDSAVKYAKETSQYKPSMLRSINFFHERYSKSKFVDENGKENDDQCPGYIVLFPEHIMTFILLSWPYFYETRNMYGENDFLPFISSYDLPHLYGLNKSTDMDEDCATLSNVSTDTHIVATMPENQMDETLSLRCYLHQSMCKSPNNSENRILKEQIRGLKRKLALVLDYHCNGALN